MTYKNIAISGVGGTGKSTLARGLAEKLGWRVVSSGSFIRKWHEENGVPLVETDKIPEEVDRKMDMSYQEMLRTEEGIVFESRLAGWLSKDFDQTFKILIKCDQKVGAFRIAQREDASVEEIIQEQEIREGLLKEKFIKLYDAGDYLDEKNFDIVIDTTNVSAKEVLETVLAKMNETSG
jgi:cytidylate kinase